MRIHTKTIIIIWSLFLIGCGTNKGGSDDAFTGDTSDVTVSESETTENPCGKCGILVDGACHPVGIQTCAEGWKKTEDCGCEPILDECGENEIPLFGGGCQKVGPQSDAGPQDECGEGKWGNIPKEVTSGKILYVWAGYTGTDSDGSQEKPYSVIQDAINEAKTGDTVAVGSEKEPEDYHEQVVVSKQIKIAGRCSKMVIISGSGSTDVQNMTAGIYIIGSKNIGISGISVTTNGSGIVIKGGSGHQITNSVISGNKGTGIYADKAENMQIQHCRIAENIQGSGNNLGIGIHIANIDTSMNIRFCDISSNNAYGIGIVSSRVSIESCMVKESKPNQKGEDGYGIYLLDSPEINIASCSIEGNTGAGISSYNSQIAVESIIVKNTLKNKNNIGLDLSAQENSSVTVSSSLFTAQADSGIYVSNSTLYVKSSMIRGNKSSLNGKGIGLFINNSPKAVINSCSIEGASTAGIYSLNSNILMDNTVIKNSSPTGDSATGRGIDIEEKSIAEIHSCYIDGNSNTGIAVFSSQLTMDSTVIRNTLPCADGIAGYGLLLLDQSVAYITSSVISENTSSGIFILDSQATVESTTVQNTKSDLKGKFGHGLSIEENSSANIRTCAVEGNHEIGISVSNSSIKLESSRICNTKPNGDGKWGAGVVVQSSLDFSVLKNNLLDNYVGGIFVSESNGNILQNLVSGVTSGKGQWKKDNLVEDVEPIGDGISVMNASDSVIVDSNIIELCERAGVIFDNSKGSFTNNIISKSQFGYVSQSSSEVEESGNMFGDNEVDKNIDPEKPLPVDNVEKKMPEPVKSIEE
jgi:parallel beta-helix repeat protein